MAFVQEITIFIFTDLIGGFFNAVIALSDISAEYQS